MVFVVPSRLRSVTMVTGVVYTSVTAVATMLPGWRRAADSITAFLLVGFWTAGVVVRIGLPVAVARQVVTMSC